MSAPPTSSKSANDPGAKPNAGDKQADKQRARRPAPKEKATPSGSVPPKGEVQIGVKTARPVDKVTDDITAPFKAGEYAPSDLFAVMNESGIEDAFSTEPPERGHQLAFKGLPVDMAVIHQIDNVKRAATG